jgi:branched-chain amino acid aminotransferase
MEVRRTEQSRILEVDFDRLQFGDRFSDHMFITDYKDGSWGSARIIPFGNIEIPPSLCSLHYGQIVFEGLKAFRTAADKINLFRPDRYHVRFLRSCERLCIPGLESPIFMQALEGLLGIDKEWVPKKKGCSLYIRPFVFATDSSIGVHVSETYRFIIITGPVGAYYKEGMNPVSLITSGEFVRAVKGGLGAAKTPANYAASLFPAEEAKKKGFTQVLWLDGIENKYVEEVGTMNIMFVIDSELVTPPLEGSILGGVTRETVMELVKSWGVPARERPISIDEVFEAARSGRLQEAFGTGTAAVISPVGLIEHEGNSITINGGGIGPFSQRLYDEITGIQYGEKPDVFGWCHRLEE